ncbi:hypothetical protein DFR58_102163 [Anaerobacterium chartisolvens]|uniref:Uncharacterized protein n=1 Tax=Anaerobacterium chartisolvens TaxID=1297424 RepID=A0A369BK73_9FIRM|nr:hypothetical protein [Anaerobacterium chartisolvens]RCX20094.1 hypothetical protein DFR58_102163 [Anaerobacterium chartisolvens]
MTEFFCMDLKSYFNHKLIAEDNCSDMVKSRFDSYGISEPGRKERVLYSPRSLPNSLEHIKPNNILFIFPDSSIDKYDNISCEGEVIYTPDLMCTSVCFLGLSDTSNLKDKVRLIFSDGSSGEIEILFYKWLQGENLYITDIKNEDCKIALKSIKDNASIGYIYSYEAKVPEDGKRLSCIVLPINPCLHILSITLKFAPDSL